MGIQGLHTFIEANTFLSKRHQLKNTSLVIDGQSLQRFIFETCQQQTKFAAYAGNYVSYAESVRKFFNVLKKCNIKPYVVMSGGKDPRISVQKSVESQVSRNNMRFNRIVSGEPTDRAVKPILCSSVLTLVSVYLSYSRL